MKVSVLNGSPKGKYSITLQSVRYLAKKFADDSFEIFDIGREINQVQKDNIKLDGIIKSMVSSDMVLFCYPVYTFLTPYQLVRFIELLKERADTGILAGRYVSQLSTSKHFYDYTAHRYVRENSMDMGLWYIDGHSADMDDLTTEKGRKRLLDYWKEVRWTVQKGFKPVSTLPAAKHEGYIYSKPGGIGNAPKKEGFDTVLITDCPNDGSSLRNMIEAFKELYPYTIREVNIGEFHFAGGCLGCFNCAFNGKCVYKDGFDDFLRSSIQNADAFVYAAEIKNHFFNSVWKCYDDRQFCNGHRIVSIGKPIGYILSGSLSAEHNLRDVLEGRNEVGKTYLTGIITDEPQSDMDITESIRQLSEKTAWALENKPERPVNFLGVGGLKIFRDLIYVMRGLMKEDHRFYKKNGIYDFPQKQVGRILQMKLVGLLLQIPGAKSKASRGMLEGMLKQYDKIIDKY